MKNAIRIFISQVVSSGLKQKGAGNGLHVQKHQALQQKSFQIKDTNKIHV
jgi:hypothetical protein